MPYGRKSTEIGTPHEFTSLSFESDKQSSSTSLAAVRKVAVLYGSVWFEKTFLLCFISK